MSDQNPAPISVTVNGDADIQLFIVDHAFRLVNRTSLPWSGPLPPGVYVFKFRRGTTISEQTIVLDPASPIFSMSAPVIATMSSAPLQSSIYTHEYHIAAADSQSRTVHKTVGAGGQLFLFIRDWTRYEDPWRTETPAAGLELLDPTGAQVADVEGEAVKGGSDKEDRWAALNLQVNPGCYLLRLKTLDGDIFEQSLVVSPEWQTQVFLLLTDWSSRPPADWRADLARATVLMAPLGKGFYWQDEELKLTDTALTWLSAGQRTAADSAIQRALDQKYRNPMLGLYAAHALVWGRGPSLADFRESDDVSTGPGDFDEPAFRRVVGNLMQVVPEHPDAIALKLWLGETVAETTTLANPPMLASSWPMIVSASATQPSLIPRGSLMAKIGECLFGSGPWLMWRPDQFATQVSGEVDVWGLLDAFLPSGRKKVNLAGYKGLDPVQLALLQHAAPKRSPVIATGLPREASAPEPQKPRNVEDLVRAIGVPLSTLESAAARLARQSQPPEPTSAPKRRRMKGRGS